MQKEDLDKTRYMSPEELAEITGKKLTDTQEMPAIKDIAAEETEITPYPPLNNNQYSSNVRELPPQTVNEGSYRAYHSKKRKFFTPKRKKAVCLAAGFLLALFVGFMLAGYSQDKENKNEASQQQFMQKELELAEKEKDLQAKRQELEQQKKELQEQEQALNEKSNRAKGRNEQLDANESDSMLGKLVDKVTGKAAERDKARQANNATSSQADSDAAAVKKSIDDAQNMLDDVNSKLDNVTAMKNEAAQLKDNAAAAYAENKGTIDKAVYYAKTGADMLVDWLKH